LVSSSSSLRGDAWTHTIILTPSVFIEVHVLRQEYERSGICVLGVSILLFWYLI